MSAFTLSSSAAIGGARPAVATRNTTARRATGRRGLAVVAALNVNTLKPMGNRVLVIADEAESTTAGGILLPTAAAASGPGSSTTGVVKSVGEEVTAVKSGDAVLVNGFAGTEVEFDDGSKGKFLTTDDIIAVLS